MHFSVPHPVRHATQPVTSPRSTLLYHEAVYGSQAAADILERQFAQAHHRLVVSGIVPPPQ